MNFFLLNVLWLATSFPIITFFPATAAMFGVVRKWVKQEEAPLLKTYFQLFKENFLQSTWIGLIWLGIAYFLLLDFQLLLPPDGIFEIIILLLLVLISLLYVFSSLYIFPIMVHFRTSWIYVVRNALLLTLMMPMQTIILTLSLALLFYFLYHYIIFIFLFGSYLSYVIYLAIHQGFKKMGVESQ